MKKIIIISDVHLSNDATYSWFKQSDAENLARFLRRTANDREVMELVLLGDIFDLWLYPLSVTPWNVQQIIGQWSNVINALRECVIKLPTVYYINGNHDMTVTEREVVSAISQNIKWITHKDYNDEKSHQGVLHVEHGNDADMFNAPPPYPSGYDITRLMATAGRVVSFFDLWGHMKRIIDRHHAKSKSRVDTFARATLPEIAMSDVLSAPNHFAHRRLELEAISTTIDIEREKLNMVDEMLEEAARYSSVNVSEPLTMPDGQKRSIDELRNEFNKQVLNMPVQPSLAHGYRANRYWNADNLTEAALGGQNRRLSVNMQASVANLFDSALAVYDLDWYAKEVLQQTNAKIVVMGHTHKAAWKSFGNRWYANSGCWCGRDKAKICTCTGTCKCAENLPTYVTVFMQDEPSVEVAIYCGGDQKDDKLIINEINPL